MLIIVSIYRFLVGALFVVVVAASAYLIADGMISMNLGRSEQIFGAFGILGGILLFVSVVIAIGITATFISIHDRLCELVRLNEQRTHYSE